MKSIKKIHCNQLTGVFPQETPEQEVVVLVVIVVVLVDEMEPVVLVDDDELVDVVVVLSHMVTVIELEYDGEPL